MYDELVLLELKEFARRPLVSVENDMQRDSADTAESVIGKLCYLTKSTQRMEWWQVRKHEVNYNNLFSTNGVYSHSVKKL